MTGRDQTLPFLLPSQGIVVLIIVLRPAIPAEAWGAPRSGWGMLCPCPALPVAGLSNHLTGFPPRVLNSWIPSFLFTEVETGSQCDLNPRPEGMFWESGGKDGFLCGVWLPSPSREPLQKDLCPDFISSTHLGSGRAPSGLLAERKAACSLCAGSVSARLDPTVISKTPVNKQFSSHRNCLCWNLCLKKTHE